MKIHSALEQVKRAAPDFKPARASATTKLQQSFAAVSLKFSQPAADWPIAT